MTMLHCFRTTILLTCFTLATLAAADKPEKTPGIVSSDFVFETAPFASCHASTIVETRDGLLAAWFGGSKEGAKDVDVWLSRRDAGGAWSAPTNVANGRQSDGQRWPCWNPVLARAEAAGDRPERVLLFYKVGPSPSTWWGELKSSTDGGRTWSEAKRLPDGIAGPIKNKPIWLADGTLLCPSSTEDHGWRIHMETTRDLGQTWSRTDALNDGKTFGAIQPTIFRHADGKLQAFCRSQQRVVVETSSTDGGKSWSELKATSLPNPNSGIDGVTLKDGRFLLVYNHTPRGRSPINLAVTKDGRTWHAAAVLDDQPGEYSYPAAIQSDDGLVHITYTWKRQRIQHAVVNPSQLRLREITNGEWPK